MPISLDLSGSSMRSAVFIHCLLFYSSQNNGFSIYLVQRRPLFDKKCVKMCEAPTPDVEKHTIGISANAREPSQSEYFHVNWLGFGLLNTVAILWGSQHVVMKSTLADSAFSPASLLNFWRFLSSALLFSPALLKQKVCTVLIFIQAVGWCN